MSMPCLRPPPYLQSRNVIGMRSIAQLLPRAAPTRNVLNSVPVAPRLVQTQATATEVLELPVTQAAAAPDSSAPPSSPAAAAIRRRLINYSPETEFTVDNAAAADARLFALHSSVNFWSNFDTNFTLMRPTDDTTAGPDTRPVSTNERLQRLASELITSSALSDPEAAAYWAYHLGRTTFFLGTSAAGALAHHLSAQLASSGGAGKDAVRTPLQNLMANASTEITNRLVEGVAMYRQDLDNIKSRAYKLPWDMTTPSHRQFSPTFVARRSLQFLGEAASTLNRRMEGASTNTWFSSNMYPPYYLANTFHYQTDGWLSSRSADMYEFSTEALFFGRQDAMQRTSLLPIADWIRESGCDPGSLKLLEVACGTGRFHTFIKDNYPSMASVASDLSPFYLARARDNAAYWKGTSPAAAAASGGLDGCGVEFMQCAAEAIPAPDESFDIVVCVYLFHELPEAARVAAAKEWARVLRPGGLLVLTDSAQLGDRPAWDANLGAFGNFNEPHYRNYIACDLGSLVSAAGLQPGAKYLASASKTLSFVKPDRA